MPLLERNAIEHNRGRQLASWMTGDPSPARKLLGGGSLFIHPFSDRHLDAWTVLVALPVPTFASVAFDRTCCTHSWP